MHLGIDPIYYLFLAPGLLLSLWASFRVKSAFHHYSQVPAQSGLSGAEAARELLRRKGIQDVQVEEVQGFLSDHYDPFHKVLRLSPDVYRGRSLAALGVAAHEAGHAIQHATDYGPLKFRSWVVKPAQIGSNIGGFLCMIGIAMASTNMVWVGVVLFSAFVLFTLVTLPVEFNASNRAVQVLETSGMIARSEVDGTRAVLNAAAMTYVAGAISAILQLLYFLIRAGILGGSRRDD
jgi:Zn-dependent membrane protease YugP